MHESLGDWTDEFQFRNVNWWPAQGQALSISRLQQPGVHDMVHWILIRWFWAYSEIAPNGGKIKQIWCGIDQANTGGQHQRGCNMDSKMPHNRRSHPCFRHHHHRGSQSTGTITNLDLAQDKALSVFFFSQTTCIIRPFISPWLVWLSSWTQEKCRVPSFSPLLINLTTKKSYHVMFVLYKWNGWGRIEKEAVGQEGGECSKMPWCGSVMLVRTNKSGDA